MAWDTVIAPAAMAITVSAARTGVPSPITSISGAMMPAVVVSATVEDPCAVFRMADSRNGKKMPTASRIDALAVMVSTMPDTAITFPSTPPAAVTNRMGPTVLSVSLVNS